MDADTEAEQFLKNEARMQKLSEAVAILHEIGFERVLRRLGEPINLDSKHPHFSQMAAAQTSENIGWYKALDMLFNFPNVVGGILPEPIEADYGGTELAQNKMGYSDKEITGAV